jgi:hypothetical protein
MVAGGPLQCSSAPKLSRNCHSEFWRGFGLDIGCIDHLVVVITNIYDTIVISILYKIFPARSVFNSRCLVTASNNGYFSASRFKYSLNGGFFPTLSVLQLTNSQLTRRLASISHKPQPGFQVTVITTNWLPQILPVITFWYEPHIKRRSSVGVQLFTFNYRLSKMCCLATDVCLVC